MEILTGGRQNGNKIYNALKLYDYINSLQNNTTVRILKEDGICGLCVDENISKQKIKDKIEELENYIQENSYEKIEILEELLGESEE